MYEPLSVGSAHTTLSSLHILHSYIGHTFVHSYGNGKDSNQPAGYQRARVTCYLNQL